MVEFSFVFEDKILERVGEAWVQGETGQEAN